MTDWISADADAIVDRLSPSAVWIDGTQSRDRLLEGVVALWRGARNGTDLQEMPRGDGENGYG